MDNLPLEVQYKLVSYFSLNDLTHCRLVSHSFKVWAEARMQLITHLKLSSDFPKKVVNYKLRHNWDERIEEEMKESYVQHKFFSKSFVAAKVASQRWPHRADSSFFLFLGEFCPNLQVLQMNCFTFSREDLALLGPKLEFFTCFDLAFNLSRHIDPSLLEQLPHLEGFICHRSSFVSDMDPINIALLESNRPVYLMESKGQLEEKTVELLAKGGSKYLHLHTRSAFFLSSLPQSLAESLVELSVNFVPTVTFCPFTLPNLLYLTIDCVREWETIDPDEFVSAPNLKCLTCEGKIALKPSYLMSFIHSFKGLKVLCVNFLNSHSNLTQAELTISLPTYLEKLSFKTNLPLELVDYYSTSLKHLVIENIPLFPFVCPKLKVLICRQIALHSVFLSRLLHLLSQCVQLAKLVLYFECRESASLQPLIDLLSGITCLTHLKLSQLANGDEDDSSPGSICFDQHKFPSLSSLGLHLPRTKIVLHLDNSFTFFKPNRSKDSLSLQLKGPRKNYSVNGSCVKVLCNQQLDKSVEVTFQDSSDSTAINWKPFNDIFPQFLVPSNLPNLRKIQS